MSSVNAGMCHCAITDCKDTHPLLMIVALRTPRSRGSDSVLLVDGDPCTMGVPQTRMTECHPIAAPQASMAGVAWVARPVQFRRTILMAREGRPGGWDALAKSTLMTPCARATPAAPQWDHLATGRSATAGVPVVPMMPMMRQKAISGEDLTTEVSVAFPCLSVSDPLCGVFMWMTTCLQRATAEDLFAPRPLHAVVTLTATCTARALLMTVRVLLRAQCAAPTWRMIPMKMGTDGPLCGFMAVETGRLGVRGP